MTIRTALATAGLAAALTVGAGTAAFAADSTAPSTPAKSAPSAQQVADRCAKVPTALDKLAAAKTRLDDRLAKLTAAKATADAAGKTKRSERLGAAITRVQAHLDKVATHTTKVQDWSSAHCSA